MLMPVVMVVAMMMMVVPVVMAMPIRCEEIGGRSDQADRGDQGNWDYFLHC